MNKLILFSLLLLSSQAYGQGSKKPVPKKPVAHAVAKKPASTGIPIAALTDLKRVLLAECADGGNDYIRAFVYQAYMRAGAQYRYQVDERLNSIPTNKENRDVILLAIQSRCGGDQARMIDNMYSAFGMNITNAKTLAQYINKAYPLAEPDAEISTE